MTDCLFCKIIKGEVSSYTLYEDDIVKVLMDAFPNSPGHILIIPKEHYLDLSDIRIDTLTHIMNIAKKYKTILEEKLNPESIVLIQNNGEAQKIKHYHLHIIPYHKNKIEKNVEEMYNIIK